jgi:hypothetical protein
MVQPRDAAAVRAFLDGQGLSLDELELARLLRFDPRCRAVICASVLKGIQETIVGLGAIDLDTHSPDLVLIDRDCEAALRDLMVDALSTRARIRAA